MKRQQIKLDREAILDVMYDGAFGCHYLVVSPGGTHFIVWADNHRFRNPWSEGDFVAPVPAVFPDGEGAEAELAFDLLHAEGDRWNSATHHDTTDEDIDVVEYVARTYPQKWAAWKDELKSWMADEWLDAINGRPNGLHIDRPWGSQGIQGEEAVECPFRFQY